MTGRSSSVQRGAASFSWHGIAALLVVLVACGGASSRATTPSLGTAQGPLRVVLFPYIPDSVGDNFASLKAALESGFESQHPDVQLEVVINKDLDVYDYSADGTLSKLLGSGPDAAQVVEVDTLLMGTLVQNRWVQPTGMNNPGAYELAWQAASVNGVSYGVPTYLCTNVIYSTAGSLSTAQNGTNLLGILSSVKPGVPPLVGNYQGSWTLSGSYVDAWADTNGTANISASFVLPLDQETMAFFAPVVNSCVSSPNHNPCLNGTYAAGTGAETAFATGQANGFFGYTERLFFIRSAAPSAPLPQVISAPIGASSHPTMFVDSLVFNPSCLGDCLAAAQAFAAYMSTVAVRNLIAFSQDGPPGTLPRYLLQASTSFYASQPASGDPMYRAYSPIVQDAVPYPNTGFPQVRKALTEALNQALIGARAPAPPPSH